MAPPLSDIKSTNMDSGPSSEEVERAYEISCRLRKEPFKLSQEERQRITDGVLRTLGHDG